MDKAVVIIVGLVVVALIVWGGLSLFGVFTGNRQLVDLHHGFDTAIIAMPDGTIIKGKCQSWTDFEGDQLQVKIDGKTYLTHNTNVVLIDEQ